MALYRPGTEETDPKKIIMSLQAVATSADTATTNIATNTADIATANANIATLQALVPAPKFTNSLGADVLLNNTANYFDGPSIAQGSTGTWLVSGTVTLNDSTGVTSCLVKLWDGATVIDSTVVTIPAASFICTATLSGYITNPAGNLKISCRDENFTTGKILFNRSGNSKDSTISAIRIA